MRANVDSGAAQHDARARQDRVLLLRCRDGDAAAREALVERFLPLARQLARRYRRGGEPLDDLYQVASLRAAQGDRSLRRAPGDGVLDLRRPHDPGRAEAPFPRQDVARAGPSRPAGAGHQARRGVQHDRLRAGPDPHGGRARPQRPAIPSRTCSRRARRSAPTLRSHSIARARTTSTATRRSPTRSASRRRLRHGRVRCHAPTAPAGPLGPRPRDPPSALPGGPHAIGDRSATRHLTDARLAADQAIDRHGARDGRAGTDSRRPRTSPCRRLRSLGGRHDERSRRTRADAVCP